MASIKKMATKRRMYKYKLQRYFNVQISWITNHACCTILSSELIDDGIGITRAFKRNGKKTMAVSCDGNYETTPGAQLRNLIGTNVFRSLMRFLHAHRTTNVPVMFDNYGGNN